MAEQERGGQEVDGGGDASAYVRLDGGEPVERAGRESTHGLWSSFGWVVERSGSQVVEERVVERESSCQARDSGWGSLNYDDFVNDVSIKEKRRWRPARRRHCFGYSGRTLARWVVTCCIGVAMGAVAIGLGRLTDKLIGARKSAVSGRMGRGGFGVYVTFNCCLGLVAASLAALLAPGAEGSGIPVVKAYLNGVRMKGALGLRVFFVKFAAGRQKVISHLSLRAPVISLESARVSTPS